MPRVLIALVWVEADGLAVGGSAVGPFGPGAGRGDSGE